MAFHKIIERELGHNIVAGMAPKVSSTRGKQFAAKAMTDNSWDTYWATPDGVTTADIEFRLKKPQPMNRIMLQEYIPLGQRVRKFSVEYLADDGSWKAVEQPEQTTTIGYKRIVRFATVKTKGIRVRILDARGPLCINNVGVYYGGKDAQLSWSKAAEDITSLPLTVNETADDAIVIDLGKATDVSSLQYLPMQGDKPTGLIHSYTVSTCDANGNAMATLASGEFSNIQNNPITQTVSFKATKTRYLKLKADRMVTPGEKIRFAKIGVK